MTGHNTMATPIPSLYDFEFPEFSRSSCVLDRNLFRSRIKEIEERLAVQEMEDGDDKRALLDEFDDDIKGQVIDAHQAKAMIDAWKAKIAMADARLKLQDAFDAYKAARDAVGSLGFCPSQFVFQRKRARSSE